MEAHVQLKNEGNVAISIDISAQKERRVCTARPVSVGTLIRERTEFLRSTGWRRIGNEKIRFEIAFCDRLKSARARKMLSLVERAKKSRTSTRDDLISLQHGHSTGHHIWRLKAYLLRRLPELDPDEKNDAIGQITTISRRLDEFAAIEMVSEGWGPVRPGEFWKTVEKSSLTMLNEDIF